MTDSFAASQIPFLDMAANQVDLGTKIADFLKPVFTDLGLTLDTFVVENLSLPDELQKILDQKISMAMLGDMNRYTQFQVAQSIPTAAANEGGLAGAGVGIGAGLVFGQTMAAGMRPSELPPQAPPAAPQAAVAPQPVPPTPQAPASAVQASPETKFCIACGKPMPRAAKFCPECGGSQQ